MLLQICDKLGVCKDMPLAYLREVQVWLPDIQWPGSKPHCPTCLLNSSVGPHAWQEGVKASRAQPLPVPTAAQSLALSLILSLIGLD